MKEYKDTLTPRAVGIAQRVLASPLASALHPHTRESLQLVAGNDPRLRFGSYSLVNIEFKRADTSITLTVRAEEEYRGDRDRDAEGNEWNLYKLWTELNWPCHGSCSPTIAIARMSFYRQVTELAAELEADFCQTGWRNEAMRMGRTAAELKEAADKAAKEKLERAVSVAVESVRRGMRVNGTQFVPVDKVTDIPDGKYDHTSHDGKRYQLVVARAEDPQATGAKFVTSAVSRLEDAPR